ncbi:MAG TPA: AsmA-like C-terminal region-containing protein [Opitutaceae bacterium]|nr:AsmA-like C-terminal region-containing protein [Opitutaceae bacterium]
MACPTPPPHPAVKSPLRFCLSCCATLACWAVWLVLGATLAGLAYVALARDLPVPGFVLRRLESRLAAADLAMRFKRVRFDLQGRLLLEDVTLRSSRFEEPLLSSRLIYVEGSFWGALAGTADPRLIRLEGATLQLPAMLSSTGVAEPLVQELVATLRRGDGRWRAEQLTFRSGPLVVTAHGDFVPPRRGPGPPHRDLPALVARYLEYARPAARGLAVLELCDEPSLMVRLDAPPGIGNTASVIFTAREVRTPPGLGQPAVLRQVAASATLRLEPAAIRPLRLHVAAREVEASDFGAREVRAILQGTTTLRPFDLRPAEAWFTAGAVTAQGEAAGAPLLHATLADWPRVRVQASFLAGAEAIAAEVEAELREQAARVRLDGRADPAFVNALMARRAPRAAPWLVLGDPVDLAATVDLAPGWKLGAVGARVHAGRLDARGVAIDRAEGRIEFDGRELRARDAVLLAGENVARGSYWMDASTRDFRILLTGALRPADLNPWFRRPWWATFWRDFEFPTAPPDADVDVAGRWNDPREPRNFIAADAAAPRVRGVDFERVRTRLFVRPQFLDGLHLDGARAAGRQRVHGTYSRASDPAGREPVRLGFDLESTLDPELFDPLLRGAARPILDDWKFNQPPRLNFAGTWTFREGGGEGDLTFAGQAQGGLKYQGFPLDTLAATGDLRGPELRLDRIEFTVANGHGRGKASLGGPPGDRKLGFDLYVQDADLGPAVRAVQEYEAARTGTPAATGAESTFLQRAATAKLAIALSAVGEPGEIATFNGSGNARLTGATLSEIHLFGLLSQVLSGLALNFSTLKLDTVHGSFDLADGRLHFPDLKVTGDSAVIDARGDYTFADNGLNFTARFKPYSGNRNLLTGTLGLVLNPLTSIIELKLSGPLGQPEWSYSLGSFSAEPRSGPPGSATVPQLPSGPSSR